MWMFTQENIQISKNDKIYENLQIITKKWLKNWFQQNIEENLHFFFEIK